MQVHVQMEQLLVSSNSDPQLLWIIMVSMPAYSIVKPVQMRSEGYCSCLVCVCVCVCVLPLF